MRTLHQFFSQIDYKKLAEQKEALVISIEGTQDDATKDKLDGILALLDSLQDTADENGYEVTFYTRDHMIKTIQLAKLVYPQVLESLSYSELEKLFEQTLIK